MDRSSLFPYWDQTNVRIAGNCNWVQCTQLHKIVIVIIIIIIMIDSAVKQWHKRLAACITEGSGHLEHML